MKKAFIKQVIRGIIGLAVSIGIFIIYYNLLDSNAGSNKLLRYILVLVITPIFFGSLLYIFGGKQLFIWGSIFGISFVVLSITVYELPWFMIVIPVIVLLVWSYIKEYLNENKVQSAEEKMILEEQNDNEKQEALVESDFKDYIGFDKKTLLLLTSMGSIYQVVSGQDKYYFIRVGEQLSGIDDGLLITDFSDERRYLSNKKDYAINKKDITSVLFKHLSYYKLPQSGELTILMKSGKKKYIILDSVDISSVKKFFGVVKCKNCGCEKEPELSENDKDVLPRLKKICLVLNVMALIAPAIFLFTDLNYKLMSSICILIPLAILVLYFKYNKILSLEDKDSTIVKRKNKIMMDLPLILPAITLFFRSNFDFNIVDMRTFISWSVPIFCIFVIAFFLFTKEYKTKKSAILVIIIALILYVPSSVIQVNYMFDQSESTVYYSKIIEMHIDTGRRVPDEYLFTIDLQSGKQMDMQVSKSFYEKMQKGQQVVVIERTGFLKIKYATIAE